MRKGGEYLVLFILIFLGYYWGYKANLTLAIGMALTTYFIPLLIVEIVAQRKPEKTGLVGVALGIILVLLGITTYLKGAPFWEGMLILGSAAVIGGVAFQWKRVSSKPTSQQAELLKLES